MRWDVLAATALLGVALSPVAAASSVTTLYGTDFAFTFIEDDLGPYGMPTVSGNRLVFSPTGFSASAVGAAGASPDATWTVNIEVAVTALGRTVGSILYTEGGTYTLKNAGGAATVDPGDDPMVHVAGELRVNAGALEYPQALGVTSPLPGFAPGEGLGWTAGAAVNVAGWGTTTLLVSLQNILSAESYLAGDEGTITKTEAALEVTPVPVPAALWLFAPAVLGLGGLARRRRT
jgi:hypothetical protein